MPLDRRQFLATGGACLASCGASVPLAASAAPGRLDVLLAAHAEARPETAGGANHYPMAAEALEAMGHEAAIDDAWRRGAKGYAGAVLRVAPIGEAETQGALGAYDRFGDWLDYFRRTLAQEPWRTVVAAWAPRLAPGLVAAAFHGLIRTAHAVRALRHRESGARLGELAVGLAYWASRYRELPVTANRREGQGLRETLEGLDHPWLGERADVGFFAVVPRLTAAALAPTFALAERDAEPRVELDLLVREAAWAFLEMLVLERHRIWLLHTVTAPAALDLLLPEVDRDSARRLVEYARQAVVTMYAAFGAPYTAGTHRRESPGEWPALIERAVASRSVHTIKLVEALARFDRDGDPLWRSVAVQWLEWK